MSGRTGTSRPFRFAVVAKGAESRSAWLDLARRAEGEGFAALLLSDHNAVQFAPMVAAVAAAAATNQLHVGTLVANIDLRSPLHTAREAATAHVLTDGRFEFGVGAGWMPRDYAAAGVDMPTGADRAERFAEAIEVIRRVTGAARGEFNGTWHRCAEIDPGPLAAAASTAAPPLLIGAGGDRMLRVAGRFADIISLGRNMSARDARSEMTLGAFRRKVAIVRAAKPDRFDDIELNVFATGVTVGRAGVASLQALADQNNVDLAEAGLFPEQLHGEVAAICEKLKHLREECDISYVAVPAGKLAEFSPVVNRLAGA